MQRDDVSALQELLFRHIRQPQLLQLLILIQIMCNDRSPKTLHKQVVHVIQPFQVQSQLELCMLRTPQVIAVLKPCVGRGDQGDSAVGTCALPALQNSHPFKCCSVQRRASSGNREFDQCAEGVRGCRIRGALAQ